MNLISKQENIIEKIIRDTDGRLVRATFAVYESNGRVKARLLHVVFIDEPAEIENTVLKLGGFVLPKTFRSAIFPSHKIISPYFSNLLYVSGSQSRAPTF